jgi:two-component system chemotaxis response regulator CheY
MKILIAEDNFVARKILCNFLQNLGTVDVASNGIEALEAIEAAINEGNAYQLICLDILMPEMTGMEVLVAIRNTEETNNSKIKAKIIMVSSIEDPSIILKSFIQQCDGYIRKPITLPLLKEELQKLEII